MGGTAYSSISRSLRSESLGYETKTSQEIFKSRSINNAMNPHGVKIRESRDSEVTPESLAIIIALDVTGSMGTVPHHLVKSGLPNLMEGIMNAGFKDSQVLFLAVGDHTCDQAPLQVGQFENNDELLDKWLTDVYLEGRGGANDGESYHLAWYFAGKHTSIDCLEKRGQKGILFTIGDEPVLKDLPAESIKRIMGPGEYKDYSSAELLEMAREKYHVHHIHIKQTFSGSRQEVMDGWKQLMREDLIVAERETDVPELIAKTVIKYTKTEQVNQEQEGGVVISSEDDDDLL